MVSYHNFIAHNIHYERFESVANQEFLRRIRQEVNSISPETSKEEITSKCNLILMYHTYNLACMQVRAKLTSGLLRTMTEENQMEFLMHTERI